MKLIIFLETLSRGISYHLRHNPEAIKLLGMEKKGGRVDFWKFYDFLKKNYPSIVPSDITNIVLKDEKKRYTIECYKNDLVLDYFEVLKEVRLHKPGLKENKILNQLKDIFQIKIRANQGHSISEVLPDLKIVSKEKIPNYLYHGTSKENIESIMKNGLNPGSRHHVHLTSSFSLAKKRGATIIKIDTRDMMQNGWDFLVSDNNVYFPEKGKQKIIPSEFLNIETI